MVVVVGVGVGDEGFGKSERKPEKFDVGIG